MAFTATVTTVEKLQRHFIVRGTIAATGNYTLHGDTLDLTPAGSTWPIGQGGINANGPPVSARVFSQQAAGASATTSEFEYRYNPGTTQANGTIQVFTGAAAQSGLTEFTAGALPAGVTGDTIRMEITFASI